jgi:stage V sporulation protein S
MMNNNTNQNNNAGRPFNYNEPLRVSTKSNPNSVAGSMTHVLGLHGKVELMAIGAGALNQALKAVAIARGFVAPRGIDLICIPAFTNVTADGSDVEKVGMKLIVEPR